MTTAVDPSKTQAQTEAQHWLRMIPKAESPKSDQFEAAQ